MTGANETELDFAVLQQHRCEDQRKVSSSVLGLLSITVCVAALLYRACRNLAKQFKFPDNTFSVALATLILYHSTILVHLATGNSHLQFDTPSRKAICTMQAALMHWSICTLVWNAMYVVVVIYLLVVRRVPLPRLSQYNRLYYLVVLGVPTLTVVACVVIGNGYTPAGDDNLCWINPSHDRLIYNTSYMIFGIIVFACVAPSVLLTLLRAYRSVDEPARARVFRSMMIRLIVLALYALSHFGVNALISVTNYILHSNPESEYANSSVFTYCMLRTYMLQTMGSVLAFLISIKKRHIQAMRTRIKRVKDRFFRQKETPRATNEARQQLQLVDRSVYVRVVSESDLDRIFPSEAGVGGGRVLSSPRTPGGRHQFPSAANTDGQTAVSIPPDPAHHRAHIIASQAYTSYILEHTRERLMSEDSSLASSSSRSLRHLDSLVSGTDFSGLSHTSYVSATTPPRRISHEGKAVTEL